MEKYNLQDVNGTKDENLKIAVVGAGLVSWSYKLEDLPIKLRILSTNISE